MNTTLGARLPDDLFEKVHDERYRVLHTRMCVQCGNKWPTTEVALLKTWEGDKFDRCMIHTKQLSRAVVHIGITQAKRGKVYSFALQKICSLGGYYRRRQCLAKIKVGDMGLEDCKARWTTGEFLSDGIVCEDVQLCAKCGSVESRIKRTKWRLIR